MQPGGADNGPIAPKACRDEIGLVPGRRLDRPLMEEGSINLWLFFREAEGQSVYSGWSQWHLNAKGPRKGSPEGEFVEPHL